MYHWNVLGQLTGASGSDAGGNTAFTYDVLGRRIRREVNSAAPEGSWTPLWDGWTSANPFERGGAFAGFTDLRGSTIGTTIRNSTTDPGTQTKFQFLPYGEVATNPAGMDVSQGEWAGMPIDNAKLYYARSRYCVGVAAGVVREAR